MLGVNSEGYLPLIIVVHYKTACNNNKLSINDEIIQIVKWMPPYWDNTALTNASKPSW